MDIFTPISITNESSYRDFLFTESLVFIECYPKSRTLPKSFTIDSSSGGCFLRYDTTFKKVVITLKISC